MSKVFISYRRDDSSGYAQTIYRELVQHFSKDQVFMDVDTIEPGVDFVRVIEEAVGQCDVLLALIGKRWASVRRGAKSRLDDPNDFVRLEISTALARDIRVIAVLVDGMRMPAEMILPPSLKALTRRNAMEISHTRFNYDLQQLITAVRKVLGATEEKRESELEPGTILPDKLKGGSTRLPRVEQPKRKLEPGNVFRDTLEDGSKGPEMAVIPAGTFKMGDIKGNGHKSERPVHTVRIAKPFAIGRYEVTFEEYDRFAKATGQNLPKDEGWGRAQRPVINVSWNDAIECKVAFCANSQTVSFAQ